MALYIFASKVCLTYEFVCLRIGERIRVWRRRGPRCLWDTGRLRMRHAGGEQVVERFGDALVAVQSEMNKWGVLVVIWCKHTYYVLIVARKLRPY